MHGKFVSKTFLGTFFGHSYHSNGNKTCLDAALRSHTIQGLGTMHKNSAFLILEQNVLSTYSSSNRSTTLKKWRSCTYFCLFHFMRYDLHLLWQCWIHYIFKTFLHRFKSIYLNKSNGYTEETFFFGSVLENYSERKTSAVRRALKIDHTHSKSKSAKE